MKCERCGKETQFEFCVECQTYLQSFQNKQFQKPINKGESCQKQQTRADGKDPWTVEGREKECRADKEAEEIQSLVRAVGQDTEKAEAGARAKTDSCPKENCLHWDIIKSQCRLNYLCKRNPNLEDRFEKMGHNGRL